jgi:hypothetical protein
MGTAGLEDDDEVPVKRGTLPVENEHWQPRVVQQLMAEADALVSAERVSGTDPRIQTAVTEVFDASTARGMR